MNKYENWITQCNDCRFFCCTWVDNNNDFQVNLNRLRYKYESFILASHAQQIFYVSDSTNIK
ncbi:hypothetical protein Lal_00039012 [Lupinus albus]|nr:hypothetical protein Lal_00039012 [Lupinus albus]